MGNADSLIRLALRLQAANVDQDRLLVELGTVLCPEDDPPDTLCELLRGRLPRAIPRDSSPARGQLVAINVVLRTRELPLTELRELAAAVWVDRLAPRALAAGAERVAGADRLAAVRLAHAAARRVSDAVTLGRIRRVLTVDGQSGGETTTRVAVIGNCTLRPLADAVEVALRANGVAADVWEAPFDQWAAHALDPDSALWQRNPAFVILYLSSLGLTRGGTNLSLDTLDNARAVVRTIAGRTASRLIVVLPEPLEEEATIGTRARSWRTAFIETLVDAAGDRAFFIDPLDTTVAHDSRSWFAPRFWYLGKLPCHPDALVTLGVRVGHTVTAAVSQRVKAVAVDLDNMIWGGTAGEDGWQGVDLDVHGRGAAWLRLQAFLKDLRSRGTLLIALSKNNEADVREVFERRSEMLLRLDDFAASVVNWRPKSENLAEAARRLNIGLADICFLDDSPFERAQMRYALRDVIVPELPEQADEYVSFLARSAFFDTPVVTEEDRRRADLYEVEARRTQVARHAPDLDAFLKDLQLVIEVTRVSDGNLERCVQLINKTNQFNVTTRRYDAAQVRRLADAPRVYAYAHRIRDRYSDQGLVGVLIAVPTERPDEYRVDTWLLSCRVMGRTIEHAMFDHLLTWLRSRGVLRLVGEYLATARNAPVSELYPSLGFIARDDQQGRYERDVAVPFAGNRFVTVRETVSVSETV